MDTPASGAIFGLQSAIIMKETTPPVARQQNHLGAELSHRITDGFGSPILLFPSVIPTQKLINTNLGRSDYQITNN